MCGEGSGLTNLDEMETICQSHALTALSAAKVLL